MTDRHDKKEWKLLVPSTSLAVMFVSIVVEILFTTSLHATTYICWGEQTIIASSDAVFEGIVTKIITAPAATNRNIRPASIVAVNVTRAYKGDIASNSEQQIAFPGECVIGKSQMFCVNRFTPDVQKQYLLPLDTKETKWIDHWIGEEKVQTAAFKSIAEAWLHPEDFLTDKQLKGYAVYFLAVQGKLKDALLIELLQSPINEDRWWACQAAQQALSIASIPHLLSLVHHAEPWVQQQIRYNSLGAITHPYDFDGYDRILLAKDALGAIYQLLRHKDVDKKLVLEIALATPADGLDFYDWHNQLVRQLLQMSKTRAFITRGLSGRLNTKAALGSLALLTYLDPRAAYPLLERAAKTLPDGQKGDVVPMVSRFNTIWAKRFVYEQNWGYMESVKGLYLLRSFGFARRDIDPLDRLRKELSSDTATGKQMAEFWRIWLCELRKTAIEELSAFEHNGPDFSKLQDTLDKANQWKIFFPRKGTSFAVPASVRTEAIRLLTTSTTTKPVGLDPNAPAEWLLDLYGIGFDHLPVGQLWVAENGTFGFGWLPDRAWGRSSELAEILKKVSPDDSGN